MSVEILRNVMDGSTREVETNSDEYVELINEMYDHEGSARPKWEITGRHHMQRLDAEGGAQEADFGYEDKPLSPVVANLEEIGPEPHPERALTPAEVESGVESWESKMESIQAAHSEMSSLGHTADRPVEKLEKTPPKERLETARGKVGRRTSRKNNGQSTQGDQEAQSAQQQTAQAKTTQKQPAGAAAPSGGASGSGS